METKEMTPVQYLQSKGIECNESMWYMSDLYLKYSYYTWECLEELYKLKWLPPHMFLSIFRDQSDEKLWLMIEVVFWRMNSILNRKLDKHGI